ncbi:pathogenesis-related protein 5-like [Brassica napus]|uniref:pathogenesis-related protein 5-like n=1 Tax=Brassica napus TaxID=3708 RepID=UPI0006AB2DE9|nr:pathogenesis-related protein 5-like [Brassica napus]
MANLSSFHILFFMFITSGVAAFATEDSCPSTAWQGTLTRKDDNNLGAGGFQLNPGASVQLTASSEWSGHVWARTGCKFDSSGHGNCVTGDCGVVRTCSSSGGDSSVAMAEFTHGEKDSYDVRLVDGTNVKVGVKPQGDNNYLVTFYPATGHIAGSSTEFTLQNNCPYTVWPGILSGNESSILADDGFRLSPNASVQLTPPSRWSGRIWARTGCNFSSSGQGKCATGDCGGVLKCAAAGGVPPVTLAEFTIGDTDFYDVSLVDGYNVKIGIKPQGGTGDCKYAGCSSDLNSICPNELRVMDPQNNVVACKSACEAFGKPEYCCTGAFDKPETCPPTDYSRIFKKACPNAYSYAYDDATSPFTCSRSNYLITFCPTGS